MNPESVQQILDIHEHIKESLDSIIAAQILARQVKGKGRPLMQVLGMYLAATRQSLEAIVGEPHTREIFEAAAKLDAMEARR